MRETDTYVTYQVPSMHVAFVVRCECWPSVGLARPPLSRFAAMHSARSIVFSDAARGRVASSVGTMAHTLALSFPSVTHSRD